MPHALVTGASRGLGLMVTLDLARRGWTVFAGARRHGPDEALTKVLTDGAKRGAARLLSERSRPIDPTAEPPSGESV